MKTVQIKESGTFSLIDAPIPTPPSGFLKTIFHFKEKNI